MSITRARGLSHVSFRAPDLDTMESFLHDFGMRTVCRNGELLATGYGDAPFLHQTSVGSPAFMALGIEVADPEALRRLGNMVGVEPQQLETPGGGLMIALTDPDGFHIEVVTGRKAEVAKTYENNDWNRTERRERISRFKRLSSGASHVTRLGHCVLGVTDFRASEQWYKERFGFLTSDEVETPAGEAMGAFLRCDLGDEPTDHHTLFLAQTDKPGFRHAAFEVFDFDDLMTGRSHLSDRGHKASWGIGRHVLGSQVFDYWQDPWGHILEHWTDGDLLTRGDPPQIVPVSALHEIQWGQEFEGF